MFLHPPLFMVAKRWFANPSRAAYTMVVALDQLAHGLNNLANMMGPLVHSRRVQQAQAANIRRALLRRGVRLRTRGEGSGRGTKGDVDRWPQVQRLEDEVALLLYGERWQQRQTYGSEGHRSKKREAQTTPLRSSSEWMLRKVRTARLDCTQNP